MVQNMSQRIGLITLLVHDYDEAIEFYTEKIGFHLIEDTRLTDTKRWVVVGPPGKDFCHLLLAKASDDVQARAVGAQSGGRIFLFLYTDDFVSDHARLLSNGVVFVREPSQEAYGMVAVFEDLYGNRWDLIQLSK